MSRETYILIMKMSTSDQRAYVILGNFWVKIIGVVDWIYTFMTFKVKGGADVDVKDVDGFLMIVVSFELNVDIGVTFSNYGDVC